MSDSESQQPATAETARSVNQPSEKSYLLDDPNNYKGYETGAADSKEIAFYTVNPEGTSAFRSVFNVVTTVAGAGILGQPHAVGLSGWLGLGLLILVAFMANYTGKILIRSMYSKKPALKLKTFRHLGEAAFGKWGGIATLATQYSVLLCAGTLYLILAGSNAKSVFDKWTSSNERLEVYIVCTTALLIFPVIGLKTMKEISIVAIFGAIASTFVVFCIAVYSIKDKDDEAKHEVIDFSSFPIAFGAFCFAFGGHSVFPTIQDSMSSTKQFNRMFDSAFLVIFILYLPAAVFGYYGFGSSTKSNVLENFPAGVVADLATCAITLHLYATIPVLMNPVSRAVEITYDVDERAAPFLWRTLIRGGIIICQTGVALILKNNFFPFMSLIGSTSVACTVFFFPCMFYLKLWWRKISPLECIWLAFVMISSTVASVIGIYQAIYYNEASIIPTIFKLKNVDPPQYVLFVIAGASLIFGCIWTGAYFLHVRSYYAKKGTQLKQQQKI